MHPIIRNILAIVAGVVLGSVVNMGIIYLSPAIIPPPEGVNPMDMESIKANFHLYEAKHFVVPIIAHALGTLVGAFVAAKLAISHHLKIALGIGGWFLIGGIVAVTMMPGAPLWFKVIDLVGAYLPMGWLGHRLAGTSKFT